MVDLDMIAELTDDIRNDGVSLHIARWHRHA
jgi:hypothetical protein